VDEAGKFLGVVLEESLVFQNKNVHLPTFINLAERFFRLARTVLRKS